MSYNDDHYHCFDNYDLCDAYQKGLAEGHAVGLSGKAGSVYDHAPGWTMIERPPRPSVPEVAKQTSAASGRRPLRMYKLSELDEMDRDIAAAHRLNDNRVEDTPIPKPANMALAFAQVPALGTTAICRGQAYTLAGVEPYTRKDGGASQILIWRSACWDCAEPFDIRLPLGGAPGINRRCSRHKRPGVRVKMKRAA